jgi:monoamine oxidase
VRNARVAPGVVTELGAEYVGPTQDRILALAAAVGVDTFKTYNEGSNVLLLDGQRSLYPAATGVSDDPDFQAALAPLPVADQMAAEVPVAAPWKAPHAEEWDRQTFADFRDQNVATPNGRAIFDQAIAGIWGADAREMSLLYALFYTACAGNASTPGSLARLITTGNGAQDSRFAGGSQLVAIRVARRLGRRVVLRAPVRRIETAGKEAVTVMADGVEVAARRVVVAVPPILAARIDYAPALPSAKRKLLRAITPGNLVKLEAVYDRPFWRDQGLSGQGVSITGIGTLPFDNSPPQGTPGIVFSFVGGDGARALPATAGARRAAFTESLVAFFGDEARNMTGFLQGDWRREPWIRGCPVGHTGRNVLATLGPQLRRPVGPIHFAGTETADFWFGYMDGAVRSGERVSQEVVRSLRR